MAVVLETINLNHAFGRVVVAEDINVGIEAGQLVGIVGPNGAGKTSFLNMVTGYIKPEEGRILYMDQEITDKIPRDITGLGIARSFQISQLFTSMSVLDNMLIALAAQTNQGFDFWGLLRRRHWIEEARQILSQFSLEGYADRPVTELPEGGRKLLDIALSFALKPRLLFMDEPTSGISVQDKFSVMDILVDVLRQSGVTTIFVEHDMDVVSRYAERMLVFYQGRVEADGSPDALLTDETVRRVLGWS